MLELVSTVPPGDQLVYSLAHTAAQSVFMYHLPPSSFRLDGAWIPDAPCGGAPIGVELVRQLELLLLQQARRGQVCDNFSVLSRRVSARVLTLRLP